MIFRPELAAKVLDGTKTQTRRRLKTTDPARGRYRPGRDYAVQDRRGGRALGRIVVIDCRIDYLGDITEEDARAEGFDNRAAFLDYWRDLYGSVDEQEAIWAITFARVLREGGRHA